MHWWEPEQIKQLLKDFLKCEMGQEGEPKSDFVQLETLLMPHKLPILPEGHAAVYVFSIGDCVLKVGKADQNAQCQYNSQYYPIRSPLSTLASSLMDHGHQIGIYGLNEENVSAWIKENTDRRNFIIGRDYSHHTGIPEWLAIFIQNRLQSVF